MTAKAFVQQKHPKKLIQIIAYKTGQVAQELDVTGKSESQIDKIDSGLNINLNHDEFYTLIFEERAQAETIEK